MSDEQNTGESRVVIGDPLLRAVQNAGKFEISVDTQRYFYTAASHRPLVKRIEILNKSWSGDDEIVVSVRTEAVGTHSLIHPWAKAYPPIQQRDKLNIDVLSIRPNFIELANIEESVVGDIVVQVQIQDQVVAEHRQKVEFLAYNQWMFDRMDSECLTAFVFPNHPDVARIMDGVRKRLAKEFGSGETDGYQAYRDGLEVGQKKVWNMAKAIFEELQSLGLEYSDPPVSFEGFGQKIRTPDVVMRERVSTCLDSTVLVASCLAAAGLSPLLFMVKNHAFPGWWTRDTPFFYMAQRDGLSKGESEMRHFRRPGTITNINDFQALVNAGYVGSFESTQIANSKVDYKDVVDCHLKFATGNRIPQFESFVDVERSSELGVRRLPNRVPVPGQQHFKIEIDRSEIEVLRPDGFEVVVESAQADEDRQKLSANDVPRRVRKWMDALLDISNTNPLVNLAQLPVFIPEKGIRGKRGVNLPMVTGLLPMLEDRLMRGETIRAVCLHRLDSSLLSNPTAENICTQFEVNGTLAIGPVEKVGQFIKQWRDKCIDDGIPPAQALAMAQGAFEKLHESEAAKRFRSLKKLADETEAESASNQLFMTIGSLVWDSPGEGKSFKQVRSPLFVVPIRLGGTAATSFTITLDKDGELSPNYCLLEKLRSEIGLRIPELESPNLDDSGIDVAHTISVIRRFLGESKFASVRVE
jgi:hypothetical protein